jgi:hypothetical protein
LTECIEYGYYINVLTFPGSQSALQQIILAISLEISASHMLNSQRKLTKWGRLLLTVGLLLAFQSSGAASPRAGLIGYRNMRRAQPSAATVDLVGNAITEAQADGDADRLPSTCAQVTIQAVDRQVSIGIRPAGVLPEYAQAPALEILIASLISSRGPPRVA